MAPTHQTARLRCFVSAGEVFVHDDGTFEVAPLSLFRLSGGGFLFRVGQSAYWFDTEGVYDGPEFKLSPGAQDSLPEINRLLATCRDNRGKTPATSYFSPGTDGWRAETAIWPEKPAEPEPEEAPSMPNITSYDMEGKPHLRFSPVEFRAGRVGACVILGFTSEQGAKVQLHLTHEQATDVRSTIDQLLGEDSEEEIVH